jgi:hypothetical protein
MRFSVEVHVVGVKGVGAGSQNGREPAARCPPYGAKKGRFVRPTLPLDKDSSLVGKRDLHEVDGKTLGVRADLGSGYAVFCSAIIAGAGSDRRDLALQRRPPKGHDNEAYIVREDSGEFAGEKGPVGQSYGFAVPCDR